MLVACPLHQHRDAAGLEAVDDAGQGVGPGGVEHRQARQAQDHDGHPGLHVERLEECGRGTEEQGTVEPVDGDVLGQQFVLVYRVVIVAGQLLGAGDRARGHLPEGEDAGQEQADLDGGDQVDGDGHHGGSGEHDRLGDVGPDHHEHPDVVDHAHRGHEEHGTECREGHVADDGCRRQDHDDDHQRMGDGCHAGACSGADVDRRPGDRPGGRHAAEEAGGHVGQALSHQLASVRGASGAGHGVRHACRQQALDGGQCRDGEGGTEELPEVGGTGERVAGHGQMVGECADERHVEVEDPGRHRGEDHGHDGPRDPVGEPGPEQHRRHHQCADHQGALGLCGGRPPDGHPRGVEYAGASGLGQAHEERHLLEADGDGDPDGEPLEDRPGHEPDEASESGHPHHHDHHAGEDGDGRHGPGPVVGHDRREHHGHGAGRPRHLHRRAAEHRGDDARHDGGDDPGRRSDAGRHPEPERQWKGHDADREARHEVDPPGGPEAGVVAASGQQARGPRAQDPHGVLHHEVWAIMRCAA